MGLPDGEDVTPPRGGGPREPGPHGQPGTSPGFVRTLLSRKSWFLDEDPRRAGALRSMSTAALDGYADAAVRAALPSSHDGGSSDAELPMAWEPVAGEAGRPARWSATSSRDGTGSPAVGASPDGAAALGVRWSDGGAGGEAGGPGAAAAQPGTSPTPGLMLERRALARRSLTAMPPLGEASESPHSSGASPAGAERAPGPFESRTLSGLGPAASSGDLAASGPAARAPSPGGNPSAGASALPRPVVLATPFAMAPPPSDALAASASAPPPGGALAEAAGTAPGSMPAAIPVRQGSEEAPQAPPAFGASPTPELVVERRASARRAPPSRLQSVTEGDGAPRATVGFREGRQEQPRQQASDLNPNAPVWLPGGT
jgi:hypothetical protein